MRYLGHCIVDPGSSHLSAPPACIRVLIVSVIVIFIVIVIVVIKFMRMSNQNERNRESEMRKGTETF